MYQIYNDWLSDCNLRYILMWVCYQLFVAAFSTAYDMVLSNENRILVTP